MKLVFAQDGGITNTGTAEEVLFETAVPSVAQTSQVASHIIEFRGFLLNATLDKRIRLCDGLGGDLFYDSGSDLNNLTGSWLMTVTDQYNGVKTIEMVAGTAYFHKRTSNSVSVPTTNSVPDLVITAECEAADAVSVTGARWHVVESEVLL